MSTFSRRDAARLLLAGPLIAGAAALGVRSGWGGADGPEGSSPSSPSSSSSSSPSPTAPDRRTVVGSPSSAPSLLTGPARGMTVSCPTWGWEWGSDDMVTTMETLHSLGVTWVAIHPYANVSNDGTLRWRKLDPDAPPDWLARPIREANRLGMGLLVKPHIAYWRSKFTWRGEIEWSDPADTKRFFDGYAAWIENLAAASRGAHGYVVGAELDRLRGEESRWRDVIARVRDNYGGPITYAANWDTYDSVPFWDALDLVGIQGYFPILNEADHDGATVPSADQLADGWRKVAARVRGVSERVDRPVLLTELGYNRSARAPVEPWAYEQGGHKAEEVQVACLRAALHAVEQERSIVGAFLWKWFPGDRVIGDFAMAAPHMRAELQRSWGT